ncbi:MAG: hypothetical protein KatS3mg115_0836 [Candidatus Poribacteria bacterium]|nr:MAG: hypothetical protein KatS3mg115_0836 [Candidatus Poribacteria bacterium]
MAQPQQEREGFLGLKEWQIAVEAVLRGEVGFLLRKGGIHEPGNRFLIRAARFWLFPTYEHQAEAAREETPQLREPWWSRLLQRAEPLRSAQEAERLGIGPYTPEKVPIEGFVELRRAVELWSEEALRRLLPWGLWTEAFARSRLRWKPRQPLLVFLLNAYRTERWTVPADRVSRRCYSWLELPRSWEEFAGEPVRFSQAAALDHLLDELSDLPEERAARRAGRVALSAERAAH